MLLFWGEETNNKNMFRVVCVLCVYVCEPWWEGEADEEKNTNLVFVITKIDKKIIKIGPIV